VNTRSNRVMVLSVHPRHVDRILDGSKTVELRRTRPTVAPGQPVAIYATLPAGALVATCEIEAIEVGSPASIWKSAGAAARVSQSEFDLYFTDATQAVALRLTTVRRLKECVTLEQLRAGRQFQPPQTWHFFNGQQLTTMLGLHPSASALTSLVRN
jgi:predicted transcriptional regulator